MRACVRVQVTQEVSGDVGTRSATVYVLDLKHRLVAGSLTTGGLKGFCIWAFGRWGMCGWGMCRWGMCRWGMCRWGMCR